LATTNTNFNPDDFWEQRLTKVKGLEGVGYAKLGKPFNYWAYKVRKAAFLNSFSALNIHLKDSAVLDIGSGTGFYIGIWTELKAASISGVDITQVAVENLKKVFPENNFSQCDIGGDISPYKNELGNKDCISCMDVLFHIVDDARYEKAILNISSLLKPGGYFFFSDNFLKKETKRTQHQVCHTKDHLYALFEKAGLEVVSHKPFMVLSNYPIDSNNKLLHAYWFLIENTVALIKPLGHLFGALLYPIEKILLRTIQDSPSSEIVVLRKK
jgi:SAM-dependent methyltransferase